MEVVVMPPAANALVSVVVIWESLLLVWEYWLLASVRRTWELLKNEFTCPVGLQVSEPVHRLSTRKVLEPSTSPREPVGTEDPE